jgi:hypothetical protein
MIGGGGPRPKDLYARRVDLALGKRAKIAVDATPGSLALDVTVTGVPMALVVAIQAAIDPAQLTDMRDTSRLVIGNDTVPIYMRPAMGGPAQITGMRPGVHTVCATTAFPGGPGGATKCAQITLDAATPKRTLALVLPTPP